MLMHATMAALAVFICFAGNYLTGQSMMERPLVVGLVTGILMGDMKTGVLMGASLEAIFLGNVNIGGVIAAEPVTATTLATTFAIISNVEQKAAMTLAVPIGMLAAFVVMFLKNVFMNIFAPSLDKAAREGNQKIGCDTALRNVDYLLFNHRFDFIYRNFSRKRASKSVC